MQRTRENIAAIVLFAALVLRLPPQLAVAAGSEPLTTAAAIARSVIAETDEPPPVRLEAVVTHTDMEGTTFLRDESGSTFIFFDNAASPGLPRGERVVKQKPARVNSPAGPRRC